MDRRTFLGVAAGAVLASELKGADAAAGKQAPPEGLNVRFLGTGAADWNGKDGRGELRRLSSVLLDNRLLIDFTHTAEDMLPQDAHPEAIFYTHSHGDHYHPEDAVKIGVRQAYIGQTWAGEAKEEFDEAAKKLGSPAPEIIPLETGKPVVLGDLTLTPLPANHATGRSGEQALIYLVEKGGARVLYATDTGGLTAVAARMAGLDAHVKEGKPITGLIMEATMGFGHEDDFRIFTHSSVATVLQTVRVLAQTGRYSPPPGQPAYITHLARTLHGTQAELDRDLPSPLRAAYDGLDAVFA